MSNATTVFGKVSSSRTTTYIDDTHNIDESRRKTAAMEVKNMTVAYQGKIALDNISLSIHRGRITGIIGPNGAGKSTLIKGMLGLVKTSQDGKTLVHGEDIKSQRKKIAYVEQRNVLDLSFPIDVEGVVMLGTYPNLGYFKRPGKAERQRAQEALATVKMDNFAKRQIGELSGGQLQRVFIARALAQEAEIFLLDEPFIGIDAVSEALIMDLLKDLKDQGKTIAIVNHDLHKVKEYFDDVVILNRHLIDSGSVENTFTTSNIRKAYGDSMGDVIVRGV